MGQLLNKRSNIKIKKVNIRGDEIARIFLSLIFFIFLVCSSFRLFAFGKLFDDFIFTLLFGWTKYLVYLVLFTFITPVFFNYYFKVKLSYLFKITLTLFVLSWVVQNFVIAIIYSSNVWFSSRMLHITILENYCSSWWNSTIINNYHGIFASPISFANWDSFFPSFAAGGIFSNFLISVVSYTFFITNFILSFLILFISLIFLFFAKPWSLFSFFNKGKLHQQKGSSINGIDYLINKEEQSVTKERLLKDNNTLDILLNQSQTTDSFDSFLNFENNEPKAVSPSSTPSEINIDYLSEAGSLTPFGQVEEEQEEKLNEGEQESTTSIQIDFNEDIESIVVEDSSSRSIEE